MRRRDCSGEHKGLTVGLVKDRENRDGNDEGSDKLVDEHVADRLAGCCEEGDGECRLYDGGDARKCCRVRKEQVQGDECLGHSLRSG